jgi:hypothetical protein
MHIIDLERNIYMDVAVNWRYKVVIKTIYVDMDGVLCDFKKRFYELYKDVPEVDYPSKGKEKKEYKKRFDEFVKDGHFATLEPMPDYIKASHFFWCFGEKFSIKILSSSASEKYLEEISKQKESWLAEWEVTYPAIFVAGKKLKKEYATPDSLLIDDTLINVLEWRDRGGLAILHKTWAETLIEFMEIIYE